MEVVEAPDAESACCRIKEKHSKLFHSIVDVEEANGN